MSLGILLQKATYSTSISKVDINITFYILVKNLLTYFLLASCLITLSPPLNVAHILSLQLHNRERWRIGLGSKSQFVFLHLAYHHLKTPDTIQESKAFMLSTPSAYIIICLNHKHLYGLQMSKSFCFSLFIAC